jgi:hypothetical protein
MTIYKVRIKTEDNKTTYTTNATTLATVTYRADLDKYDVSTPNSSVLADTEPEAQNTARESVTAFLATLGIVPEFIND